MEQGRHRTIFLFLHHVLVHNCQSCSRPYLGGAGETFFDLLFFKSYQTLWKKLSCIVIDNKYKAIFFDCVTAKKLCRRSFEIRESALFCYRKSPHSVIVNFPVDPRSYSPPAPSL